MIDDRGRESQATLTQGPPPLGPGAPPAQRLCAFLHALADHTETQADLLQMAESGPPAARFRGGSYGLYHRHLAMLIAETQPEA